MRYWQWYLVGYIITGIIVLIAYTFNLEKTEWFVSPLIWTLGKKHIPLTEGSK